MRQVLDVILGIKRFDRDPFERFPSQAFGVTPLEFLLGNFTPDFLVRHICVLR